MCTYSVLYELFTAVTPVVTPVFNLTFLILHFVTNWYAL